MSEEDDDADDEGDGDGVDDDDDNGGGTTKVAGVSPGAAAAAAAAAAKTAGPKTGAFLPPIEVELQMQQLWRREGQALDLIFAPARNRRRCPDAASPALEGGRGDAATPDRDGYRVFFIRALAVPPPRFRPPMHMGDMIAEHPQNVYLTKVGFFSWSSVFGVVVVVPARNQSQRSLRWQFSSLVDEGALRFPNRAWLCDPSVALFFPISVFGCGGGETETG